MNVTFTTDGRAIFEPFTAETDTDAETGKVGVRTHYKITGFFLSFFGKAEKLYDSKGEDFYVNLESSRRFLRRHNLPIFTSGLHLNQPIDIGCAIEIAQLNTAIKEDPADIASLYNRAKIFGRHGNPIEAIQDYSTAIKLTANEAQKLDLLSHTIQYCKKEGSMKSLEIAASFCTEMISLNTMQKVDDGLLERAGIFARMDNLDSAIQDYTALCATLPNQKKKFSFYPLSLLYLKKGDIEAAINAFNEYKKLPGEAILDKSFSTSNYFLLELSKIYIEKKMYDGALYSLNQIMEKKALDEKSAAPNKLQVLPEYREVASLIKQARELKEQINKT